MSSTNPHVALSRDTTTAVDVDTDASGDVTVTFGGLASIASVADVSVSATGGYTANVQSVSGNTATVRVFQGGGADTPLAAVASGTDVTTLEASALGE